MVVRGGPGPVTVSRADGHRPASTRRRARAGANRVRLPRRGTAAGAVSSPGRLAKRGGAAAAAAAAPAAAAAAGDGATDAQAKPPANAFVGFGGVVTRDAVRAKADWFVYDFKEMTKIIKSR